MSDEKKYFAMIPYMAVEKMNLTKNEKILYLHLKVTCGEKEDGFCNKSVTTLADECGISRPSIIKAKRGLLEKGLITVELTDVGRGYPGHKIRIVNIWAENIETYNNQFGNNKYP